MKVLVIGGGGREHALAWKLAQSPKITQLFAAPGNPGISKVAECVPIDAGDIDRLVDFAIKEQIDWTVVGPEAPLCDGIVDKLEVAGLKAFGPSQAAAQLEGSKIFSKEFMVECGIPTAPFEVFSNLASAQAHLNERTLPCVIKADGLAAGKGVFVCQTEAEAEEALDQIFTQKTFGEAGEKVLIEDCLIGVEASFLVISDGHSALPLEPAKDHKPIFDGDRGPNTGGMGTYSPTPTMPPALRNEILSRVITPALAGMRDRGMPFKGILYAGLMLTDDGPQVLEFNVRFGDPEAQVILPRLKTDLIDILEGVAAGSLAKMSPMWESRHALCVVAASAGYPGKYEKGDIIAGLDIADRDDLIIFHAGTKQFNGELVTSGGRVLGVTALAKDRETAQQKAYDAIKQIHWKGIQYRKDIGNI